MVDVFNSILSPFTVSGVLVPLHMVSAGAHGPGPAGVGILTHVINVGGIVSLSASVSTSFPSTNSFCCESGASTAGADPIEHLHVAGPVAYNFEILIILIINKFIN